MRKARTVVLILVCLVAVALIALRLAAPRLLVREGQELLSRELHAEVRIAGIELSLLKGHASLVGLRIAEPEGFDGVFLDAPRCELALRPAALLRSPLRIDEVTAEGAVIELIRATNGTINTDVLFPTPTPAAPGEMEEPYPAIVLGRLTLTKASVTYRDEAAADRPVFVRLRDVCVTGHELFFDPQREGEPSLPGTLRLTARLDQAPLPDGLVGLYARTGIVSTNVTPANAAVLVGGLQLAAYEPVVPMGTAKLLGGDVLDVEVDAALSPVVLDAEARVTTLTGTLPLRVRGTPDLPQIDKSDALGEFLAHAGSGVGRFAGKVTQASGKAAGAAVDTATTVAAGTGKAAGVFKDGIRETIAGFKVGDKAVLAQGLKKATVQTAREVAGAATGTVATLSHGASETASAGSSAEDRKAWQNQVAARWQTAWEAAPARVAQRPFPRPPAPAAAGAGGRSTTTPP